tara:strand:+ start:688 stop:1014 length:327 start_codon:yes stop_codon:yes gene_type:complete
MLFLAHLLKTPNRHADNFGVFNATQRCLSRKEVCLSCLVLRVPKLSCLSTLLWDTYPFCLTTLTHNQQRNKEKSVMSLLAHLLKTPNRRAGAFSVFHASPEKKYACLV